MLTLIAFSTPALNALDRVREAADLVTGFLTWEEYTVLGVLLLLLTKGFGGEVLFKTSSIPFGNIDFKRSFELASVSIPELPCELDFPGVAFPLLFGVTMPTRIRLLFLLLALVGFFV